MPVPFQCPHCGKVTHVSDEYVGQSGPCASCGATVTISAPQKPTAAKGAASAAGMSMAAVAMIAVLVLLVCGGVAVALLLPAVESARGAAQRAQCGNNLKQIALAMHNYHDMYKALPPAYTVDADGNKLHSWRTLLLPFLEQQALYDRIDLTTPWDSPQNQQLADVVIPLYHCAAEDGAYPSRTDYMVIVGAGTLFEGPNQIRFADVTDGLSNTVMVVEVKGSSTSWMEPKDLELETMKMAINGGAGEMGSNHPGGMMVVLADGSIQFLADTIDLGILEGLISRNDGKVIRLD